MTSYNEAGTPNSSNSFLDSFELDMESVQTKSTICQSDKPPMSLPDFETEASSCSNPMRSYEMLNSSSSGLNPMRSTDLLSSSRSLKFSIPIKPKSPDITNETILSIEREKLSLKRQQINIMRDSLIVSQQILTELRGLRSEIQDFGIRSLSLNKTQVTDSCISGVSVPVSAANSIEQQVIYFMPQGIQATPSDFISSVGQSVGPTVSNVSLCSNLGDLSGLQQLAAISQQAKSPCTTNSGSLGSLPRILSFSQSK